VSFPFHSALLFASAAVRRRAFLRAIALAVLALAGLLGSSGARAALYTFSGNTVQGCTLAGRIYSCPDSVYERNDDSVVIGNGYTLKLSGSVALSQQQGLSMGANTRFVVSGDLDLSGARPSNLEVSGGAIEVGGTFSTGGQAKTLTADITAGAIELGNHTTITGNLTSNGVVDIGTHANITGAVRGSVISANAQVTITGKVFATSRFTLATGGTVTDDITAPVFDMQASNSKVDGNIVASTSVTMGSGSTVTGNIDTGTFDMHASGSKVIGDVTATSKLTMGSGTAIDGDVDTGILLLRSSSAIITGNAKVDWATLEWAGRVTGIIYCKNGTATGKCDCVTNNSGYPVNTVNGPRCESVAPTGPHHFLVTHDGEGDTCLEEKITVTACANAACTAPHYSGAVSGTLGGVGTPFDIAANAGSVIVSAKRFAEGLVTLGVTGALPAAQHPAACYRTSNNTNSCAMNFAGGVKLAVSVPDHAAGTPVKAMLQALKANDSKTACVAAFANAAYDVAYGCNYSKPRTGTLALALGGKALACGASGAAAPAQLINTEFKAEGRAELALAYADAGEVRLKADVDTGKGMSASGEGTFVAAPASFKVEPAVGTIRAGARFAVKLTALNTAGAVTPNFDTDDLNSAGATVHNVALDVECHAQAGNKGMLALAAPASFVDGVSSATASWSDVGRIDLKASLTGFLGTGLAAGGSTNTAPPTGCAGRAGPFIPAYFKLALGQARTSYYSGEPFPLVVTAVNTAGEVTINYAGSTPGLSEALTLTANDQAGAPFAPGFGALANEAVPASAFTLGVAHVKPAYAFSVSPTSPTQIRLRASNGKPPGLDVLSSVPANAEAALPVIRSGRLRVGSRFGGLKSTLSIPVTAEYWTGKSWLLNSDDSHTVIPMAAFAFKHAVAGMKTAASAPASALALAKGASSFDLRVTEGGPGTVNIALNLGSGAQDNACIGVVAGTGLPTTGAAIAWLRPLTVGCATTQARDPWGRATFGIFTPENRRIIHVREVFN
jgi:MSHA biogenesis protein MshQ